jgi:hypothetical protein
MSHNYTIIKHFLNNKVSIKAI